MSSEKKLACSSAAMCCAWCWILASWQGILCCSFVFGNQGCLQIPILLFCWPQHVWVLAVGFPWLSFSCAYLVQRHETLSEHLPWRQVVSLYADIDILWQMRNSPNHLWSSLLLDCVLKMFLLFSHTCLPAFHCVRCWLFCWISFSLILALLRGIR